MFYTIWCEGYSATGQSSGAVRLGSAYGDSFKEACDNLAKVDSEFRRYYNPESQSYWGCQLFASESSARRSYG